MKKSIYLIKIFVLLVSTSASAFGPKRLKPEDLSACEELAHSGFTEWKKADLSRIPRATSSQNALPFEVNLNLSIYNHKSWWEESIDDSELRFHVETAREVYASCGISLIIESIRYLSGPKFLDQLDRNPNDPELLSDQEKCLFTPTFKPGSLNIYFVSDVRSEQGVGGPSHAILSGDFRGAVVIADANRKSTTPDGKRNEMREILLAHEIGHILFNSSRPVEGLPTNLMNHDAPTSLFVTPEQCAIAARSPFVRSR